jgi:hypothetical protein
VTPRISAQEGLAGRELPAQIAQCEIFAIRAEHYDIHYRGRLGKDHGMLIRAIDDEAQIIMIVTTGWFGSRERSAPGGRFVGALRELGFRTMVLPHRGRHKIKASQDAEVVA